MKKLLMRVRIENGECLPQKSYLADPLGCTSRDEFLADCMKESMSVSVQELKECIEGQVFDEDEDVLVSYTPDEVLELLQDASIVFLWCNMPESLRRMFATRNVIPISRKMRPLDQALVVVQHLKTSQNKRSEWKQMLDKHLNIVHVPSLGCDLKTIVLQGTLDDMVNFVNQPIYPFESRLVPKEAFVGYLFSSYSSFFDFARAEHWLDLICKEYDSDLRFLEEILHSIQHITFFRNTTSSRAQEKGDLLQRIRRLEAEIESLKEQNLNEVHGLLEVIETLSRDKQVEQWEESDQLKCLEGRKIAVVGDDVRQTVYKMLLEREGAIPIFVPGFEKLSAGAERFRHVDGVIFVTAYSSHSLYYALKARRTMRNTVLVNQCGMKSFQDGITQLRATFPSE